MKKCVGNSHIFEKKKEKNNNQPTPKMIKMKDKAMNV